jgi:dTDP-4-amino-4,6-dideoxygalactose transaminase
LINLQESGASAALDPIEQEIIRKRQAGTAVTLETFLKWREAFEAEQKALGGEKDKVFIKSSGEPTYRLPDIACALGISQMGKLPRFAARRRRLAALYREALAPLAPLVTLPPPMPWSDPVLHLMCALIDFEAAGVTRREVMEGLSTRGIGSQVHYIPVHSQPYWQARNGLLALNCATPGALEFCKPLT